MNVNYNSDYSINILVIGDNTVGKTSFIGRHCDHLFIENNSFQDKLYLKSSDRVTDTGDLLKSCYLVHHDKTFYIKLWKYYDKRYGCSNFSFYRGAQSIFILFDCTNLQSFIHVPMYIRECERYAREDVTIIMIGCKIDDIENRVVSQLDAIEMAEKYDIPYFEVNSKHPSPFEMQTFDSIFQTMAKIIIERQDEEDEANKPSNVVTLKSPKQQKQQSNKSILKFWKQ